MFSTRFLFSAIAAACLPALALGQKPASPQVAIPDRNVPHPAVSIGHRDTITAVFSSPDGRKIFTSDNKQLRVWDAASRKEIKLLKVCKETPAPDWNATFVPERKWMIATSDGAFAITDYETLQHVTGGSLFQAADVVYDPQSKRVYYCADYHIGEIAEKNGEWTGITLFSIPWEKSRPYCQRVIPLTDGRLFLDLHEGYAVVDPKTWTLLERNSADRRNFFVGPAGTILAFTEKSGHPYPSALVERISATDLSVQGSLTLPILGNVSNYAGPQAFDPDTKTLCLSTSQEVFVVNFDTMTLRDRIQPMPKPDDPFIRVVTRLTGTGEWVVTANSQLRVVDLASKRTTHVFGDNVFNPRTIATSPSGFEFIVTNGSDNMKRLRFTPAGLQIGDFGNKSTAIAYAPDNSAIVTASLSEYSLAVSEPATFPKTEYALPSGQKDQINADNVTFSADGTLLATRSYQKVSVISMANGSVVFETSFPHSFMSHAKGTIALSPDNKLLIVSSPEGDLIGYDLKTKKSIWTERARGRTCLYFIAPDIFACVRNNAIEYRAADTGGIMISAFINTYYTSETNSLVCAVSHDRKRLAVYDGVWVHVYDAETGDELLQQWSFARVTDVEFLGNSRYIVTACEDSLLRILDVDQKRELCSLALFSRSNDWVATTPDFRFDASQKAIDRMYVVNGAAITPLDSLFEKLYTPKLVSGLLAGEKLEPPAIDFAKLSPPPTVRLEFAEVTRNLVVEDDLPPNTVDRETIQVRATALAADSSLRELRLFQNGKLVATAPAAGSQYKHPFDVSLVPGENVFRAIATNEQKTESRPAEVLVTYRPKAASSAPGLAGKSAPAGLQLHLLIVGVNTYKNPKYNLNYAVADATAVKEQIEAQTKTIFTGVNVQFILNEKAQKTAIVDAFKSMTAAAGPRDVFVFYYAGHGVMTSDATPEFFLVPHDVTQLYGADEALRQKGLSSAELQELAKAMPAQKQLFILDACQSAGALKTVAMRGAAEEKAIAQLARSTGTHWLTASGSEQFATEFAQLGHGAFTYALLAGLGGKADTGDGRITVNELKAFLETEVPEITQKHKGTPQFPSSYGFGQDFPVVVVSGK
jgi:WD40 repeat protein